MFTTSATWNQQASGAQFVGCHLLQIDFDSGSVRLSDLTITIDHDNTQWDGIGTLGSIEPVRSSATGEVIAQRFTLSGVPTAAISLVLLENYQSRPLQLWAARFDPITLQIVEKVRILNGLVSTLVMSEESDGLGRVRTIQLTAESKNVLLSRGRGRFSNDEDHRSQYPNDGFFKKVAMTSVTEVVWPSKEAQAQYA